MATWLQEQGVRSSSAPGTCTCSRQPSSSASPTGSSTSIRRCCREFPGARAIDDALAAGVETTGVTVHLVDEGSTPAR